MNNNYSTLFVMLLLHLLPDYGVQGMEWFKSDNNVTTTVSGCDIELIWNFLIKRHSTTVIKVEEPGHKLNDDERYVIHTTETEQGQDISMIIPHVTVQDSGVYRCTADYTRKYRDVHLKIMDFQWNNYSKSMDVRELEDINMEWKYVTLANFKYYLVYRVLPFSENPEKQYLGNLTADNMDSQGETRVDRARINKDGDGVVLTLRNVTEDDVKYNYFVELVYSDSCSLISPPSFLNKGSKVYSQAPVIKIEPKEDVSFVWNYEYISPVFTILFTRQTENTVNKIGYWHDSKFVPTIQGGKSRLKFNKTDNGVEGQITLTLLDASREDINYAYSCRIIFHDKQESSWNILLEGKAPIYDSLSRIVSLTVAVVGIHVVVSIFFVVIMIRMSRKTESARHQTKPCTVKKDYSWIDQVEMQPLRAQH